MDGSDLMVSEETLRVEAVQIERGGDEVVEARRRLPPVYRCCCWRGRKVVKTRPGWRDNQVDSKWSETELIEAPGRSEL